MKQLAILVIAVVIGMIVGQWVITQPRPAATPFRPAVVPVSNYGSLPTASPVVTLDEYNRLRSGMSYWETRAVIGDSGTEVSRNHMEGIAGVMESIDTVMYLWANGDGSNMNAMFQNDKLIQKAQFGLR